jgi:hypothetical protein
MIMETDFDDSGSKFGLVYDEFSSLDEEIKKKIKDWHE